MRPNKSPGPDGFNPAFYQKIWNVVGEDVFLACTKWLRDCQFPPGLNDILVTLILKCERPNYMKELRPIVLCNVIYKILSKFLYNRVKSVLPHFVDPSQSVFVVGSSI